MHLSSSVGSVGRTEKECTGAIAKLHACTALYYAADCCVCGLLSKKLSSDRKCNTVSCVTIIDIDIMSILLAAVVEHI